MSLHKCTRQKLKFRRKEDESRMDTRTFGDSCGLSRISAQCSIVVPRCGVVDSIHHFNGHLLRLSTDSCVHHLHQTLSTTGCGGAQERTHTEQHRTHAQQSVTPKNHPSHEETTGTAIYSTVVAVPVFIFVAQILYTKMVMLLFS